MGDASVPGRGARGRRVRAGFGVAGVAVVLAAGSGSGPGTVAGRFDTVARDRIATEVLWADKITLIEFAETTVTARCMAQRGYPQLREAGIERSPSTFTHLDPAATLVATADVEVAAKSGFGKDEPARPAEVTSDDPTFEAALPKCARFAADLIGPAWPDVRTEVHDLVSTIAAEVDTARRLSGPGERRTTWITTQLDCLDRRGHHQSSPGERTFESYSIGVRQGTHTGPPPAEPPASDLIRIVPATPPPTHLPPPAEATLAVAYAECAAETDVNNHLIAQDLALERAAITAHESTITDLTPLITTLAESAEALVTP